MRGQQSLFQEVFVATAEAVADTPALRQGRSERLHNRRNECLIDRYYYYGKFTDKRYESILSTLEDEFFIEEITIQKRITENIEQLQRLKTEIPAREYFKKKWPHLVWAA